MPTMKNWLNTTHHGDCRRVMRKMIADGVKVQTVVTSPPYWGLRDYGVDGQLGLERTPIRYLARMRSVFRLLRELLADDGTVWLNMGDCYYTPRVSGGIGRNSTINGLDTVQALRDGQRARNKNIGPERGGNNRVRGLRDIKEKDMVGMPWMLALALRADGWYLRSDIIWHKKNPMPESISDRPTKSHEYLFLLSKSKRYYYDAESIKEPISEDTHARMSRAFAGHEPPGQTAHGGVMAPRSGVNPKAQQPKPVAGWASGPGAHDVMTHAVPKTGDRKWGNKQNESFSQAISKTIPGNRNRRTVWSICTSPFEGAHFATFPPELIQPCILAGAPGGGVVFDPFHGSGTTGQVARSLGRQFIGIDLNEEYISLEQLRPTTIGFDF